MNPWFETAVVVLASVLGIFLGKVSSDFRKPYWTLGYFLPCIAIILLILAKCNNLLYFVWPFSWITNGRARFFILSFAVSMGMTAPLSRLPHKWERFLVCVLMISAVIWSCVLPFLVPALMRGRISTLNTRFESNGICLQTTDFTCAPAAAVTALRQLGLSANERELATLSYSNPIVGTIPTFLCSTLKNLYGTAGLRCQYRHFDSVDQLKDAGITLVAVRDSFLLDHCVAILDISENTVTAADPIIGKMQMSREQFEKVWRFSGIVLELNGFR